MSKVANLKAGQEINGVKLLFVKPISNNPLDAYLQIVLAEKTNGEYVTWLYNETDKGFHNGHYYYNDQYQLALDDYFKRD